MSERGSDKHGSELDDQMKHEADGALQGVQPGHREEFRQSEPFTDHTDPEEVQDAPEGDDPAFGPPPAQED